MTDVIRLSDYRPLSIADVEHEVALGAQVALVLFDPPMVDLVLDGWRHELIKATPEAADHAIQFLRRGSPPPGA